MPFGIEVVTRRGIKIHPIYEGEIIHVKPVDPKDRFLFIPKKGAFAKQTGDDEITISPRRKPTHFFHGEGVSMLKTDEGRLVFIPSVEKPSK